MKKHAYLSATEVRRLAADAVVLAAAVKLWVPARWTRQHRIAARLLTRLSWHAVTKRRGGR